MTLREALLTSWDWEPSIVIGCAGLVGGYLMMVRGRLAPRAVAFFAGVAILLLTLVSPLDMLADDYLFSAHMLEHLFLILVVPPLLLIGLPPEPLRRLLARPLLSRVERFLSIPPVAWLIGIGTVWVWHDPRLYDLAVEHENIHILQHLMFLVASTIFWWPVFSPLEERRIRPGVGVVYLICAGVAETVLAILITYSPPGLYPVYLHPKDPLHILDALRNEVGLTPDVDQQLGGLLMWGPSGLVYLAAILLEVGRWFRLEEQQDSDVRPPDDQGLRTNQGSST